MLSPHNQVGVPNPSDHLLRPILVVAICLLVGAPVASFVVNDASGSIMRLPLSPNPNAGDRVGQSMIEEAEASLQHGQGPAHGAAVDCSGTSGGVTCSTSSTGASPNTAQPSAVTPSFPSYSTPSPRFGAPWTDVPDSPSSDFLLLFGGANSSGLVFGDTWSYLYTSSSSSWVNETASSCGGVSNPCPAPRHDQVLVWDSKDEFVLMFGGCGAPTSLWIQSTPGCPSAYVYGDTWKWTPSAVTMGQGSWAQVKINGAKCGGPGQATCSSTHSPSPRYASGIAAPPAALPILFGGCGGSTCPLSDTWTFVNGGSGWGNWTKLSPGQSPSARYGASMVYDLKDDETLLFGGCGNSVVGCTVGGLDGDTWQYTSTGGWAQIGSCGGPSQPNCPPTTAPSKRYFAMISDPYTSNFPSIDYVSLSGGTTGSVSTSVLNDSWQFHLGVWTRVTLPWVYPPSPPPRYDGDWLNREQEADFFQMFGGTSPSGSSLGDNYLQTPNVMMPPNPRTWPPITPSPRASFSLAYDGSTRDVVMFGGCGQVCPSNETWIYGRCTVTVIAATECSPILAGQMVWVNLTDTGPAPSPRTYAAMGFDPSVSYVILFGGLNGNGTLLSDTWYFTGTGWTPYPACTMSCPAAREQASMASFNGSNSTDKGVIMFGGIGVGGGPLSDTWYFTFANGWSQPTSRTGPTARYGAGMTWDPTDTYVVLFGGETSSGLSQQTWKLTGAPLRSIVWASVSCTAPNCPPAEVGGGMDFDANDNYVALFENGNPTCSVTSCWTTWGYTGSGGWSQKASPPSCLPGCAWPLTSAPISYSGSAKFVLLFGGTSPNGSVEAHTYAWGAGLWVPDLISNPTPSELAPSPISGATMAYDPSLLAVILVGGCAGPPCAADLGGNPGMWAFQDGAWHFVPISTTVPFAPDRLNFASMAYIPTLQLMVVAGGFQIPGGPLNPATWELTGTTLQTLNWAQTSGGQPTARWGAAFAYDSVDQYLVLFGGCSAFPTPGNLSLCSSVLGDTWTFNGGWTNLGVISGGPSARFGAASATGPSGFGAYIVDGFGVHGPTADEWEFVNHVWNRLSVIPPFSPRWGAMMDYDSIDGALLLFGGFGLNASGGPIAFNDTWSEPINANWNSVGTPPFPNFPEAFGSLAFDPDAGGNGLNIQFGGTNATTWQVFGSTWYFTIGSGWVNISPWT
jgi:galactose oxidase-like protein